ncbi:tyrosine-type recombinase/integrase [Streptomyces sp. NPDC091266]|uniref:tyrosine-type recombinase/integrase n=1 Tax=Streptomyces sp. NPDC091266 TaxID=3365978 RepID=UPI00380989D7
MAKTRATGEGTIAKRTDARYQAAAYIYRPDRTKVRKSVYGNTREEIGNKLVELREETRQGIQAATSAMSLGPVFITATGRATGPRSMNRMLTILCPDAKVRRVRVHDLRHTCASLLLAQGVDARTIMETLGHSTITMPLDTYAHVMQTTPKAAADQMDHALGLDEPEGEDDGEPGSESAA